MEGLLKRLEVVALPVSDWQRSKKFYGETLGLPVAAFLTDEIGWMEFGDKEGTHVAIGLWNRPEPFPGPTQGGANPVFEVDDAFAAVTELRRRGVRCDDPVGLPGMVTWANFYDPDGNRLQVAGPPPKQ
ncbi:MAG: VOC family protein [Rudaea sp.]